MNIILIGFMGSGKSSVARVLSEKLNLELIDLDELVLKESGRQSIAEIFEKDGEAVFRQMEIDKARSLLDVTNVIISTGGGVIRNQIILDYLGKNGKVIYLETSFKEISNRLKDDKTRPLFKDQEKAKNLYEFRKKLYEEYADITVLTDNKTTSEVAEEIIRKMSS